MKIIHKTRWNWLITLGVILLTSTSWAATEGDENPVNEHAGVRYKGTEFKKVYRTVPGGILYPGYFDAASKNAGSLSLQRGQGVQVKFSPGVVGENATDTQVDYALSKKGIGFGFGLNHSYYGGEARLGLNAGIGASIGPLTGGFNFEQYDLSSGGGQSYSLSLTYAPVRGLNFGLKVHSAQDDFNGDYFEKNSTRRWPFEKSGGNQLELGFGYGQNRQYNLEANWLIGTGDPRTRSVLRASGAYYVSDKFGLGASTQVLTKEMEFEHVLSGTYWIGESLFTIAQYKIPDTFTVGMSLFF